MIRSCGILRRSERWSGGSVLRLGNEEKMLADCSRCRHGLVSLNFLRLAITLVKLVRFSCVNSKFPELRDTTYQGDHFGPVEFFHGDRSDFGS